jgi:hypothetical protein
MNYSLFCNLFPLCNYKVWIDTIGGPKVISYLCLMARLNMMEEEFRARRMEKRKCTTYFAMRREMDREPAQTFYVGPLFPGTPPLSIGPVGPRACPISASIAGKRPFSGRLRPSPRPADRWAPSIFPFLRLRPSPTAPPPFPSTSGRPAAPLDT